MTKIFEALENAGLERYNLQGSKVTSIPLHQTQEYVPHMEVEKIAQSSEIKIENSASISLYQNIAMLLPNMTSRVVQFQAAQIGEGTSTLVRELAKAAAFKLNKTVLLLDLNQKRPNQCSYFNMSSELSWKDIPDGSRAVKETCARVKNTSLYVTQLPTNMTPSSIIGELPQIETFIERLKKEFDLILIDSPSAISCAECLMLTPKVDGVVLVVEAEKTRWQTVDKIKTSIQAYEGKILGVVLNKRRYPIPNFIYNRI